MMKLSKLTDYAIVVLGQLAREDAPTARSAHYLSQKSAVPEPTVAKLLKLLAKGGLVMSVRGAGGGYQLARPASAISVADIITVVDGPVAIVSCVPGSQDPCKISSTCAVRGNWDRINAAITEALSSVRLSDMAAPDRRPAAPVLFRESSHVAGA